MNSKLFIAAGVLALASCSTQPKTEYNVTAELGSSDFDGQTAYLYNQDQDAIIDSAVVAEGVVVFNNNIENSANVALQINGRNMLGFILEADSISISREGVNGGALNGKMKEFNEIYKNLGMEFQNTPDSLKMEVYQVLMDSLSKLQQTIIDENADNALGVKFLLQNRFSTLAEIDSVAAKYPVLNSNANFEKQRKALVAKDETSEGKMFKDFEVTYNDSTFRLSEVVGQGKYVLVDFWASWCGPCIRQTSVIKEILKEYGPKGLEVLGVAVWDKPEDTLQGIKDHDLPWRNVINAQTIPSEIYGFSGIPCIILFGPDGTILSRDKQSEELKADVAAAFENK